MKIASGNTHNSNTLCKYLKQASREFHFNGFKQGVFWVEIDLVKHSLDRFHSIPQKTVIKHLIRRKHCWLRRAKEQGRPKIFFPVFLLVQDLPQCKGCAKDVQDPVKSLCKGSTSMYKNKYVQGYARSLPSTAVVQNLYETCTRLQYSVCRNEAASIRNGSAKTLCSADLRYATHAY